jgi:DNA-binding GntR family transcriptional regulator
MVMSARPLHNTIKQIPRPKSLTEIAVEYIREAITKGNFGLGQHISENSLAASLGISKTQVREALAQLKMEGLVKIFPQKGTFVFTMTEQEVIDICELRFTLESAALKLAIARSKQEFLDDLKEVVSKMTAAHRENRKDEYLDLDTDFHLLFFKHCGNQFLDDAYRLISARVAAVRTHLASVPHHMDRSFDEHVRMKQNIEKDNVAETLNILVEHITRTKQSASLHIPRYSL